MIRPLLNRLFGRDEAGDHAAGDAVVNRATMPWAFRRMAPYLGAAGTLVLVGMVLLTMYFTWLDWQWVTFLSGILGAAILSLTSRTIHAQWMIARRTAQWSLARQKLAQETRLRARAEQDLAGMEKNIKYLQEMLPAMLATVDDQHQVTFHNRAFRTGMGAGAGQIDGCHLREIIGAEAYDDIEDDLCRAFGGGVVYRERLHRSTSGAAFRLLWQCLPAFTDSGAVAGVFLLATDITARDDVIRAPAPDSAAAGASADTIRPPPDFVAAAGRNAAETMAEVESAANAEMPTDMECLRDDDGLRLRTALAQDEFCLFFQTIEPLSVRAGTPPFHEILLRLKAEEDSMMPPGSFLPVAEKHGMLPDLDRWVVRHLCRWIGADPDRRLAVYSINPAVPTWVDQEFPAFVKKTLHDAGLPGSLLCIELQEADVLNHSAAASRMVAQLKPSGCQFALCGFRGSRVSFELLRHVPVDFLKIDGSLVLNIRRSAVDLARVKAIHRVAGAIAIGTIAECVEDQKTLAQLRSIGVNFAQGFVISLPQDLQHMPTSPLSGVSVVSAQSAV